MELPPKYQEVPESLLNRVRLRKSRWAIVVNTPLQLGHAYILHGWYIGLNLRYSVSIRMESQKWNLNSSKSFSGPS